MGRSRTKLFKKGTRRILHICLGVLAPTAALTPAFQSLWQIGLSGLRQPTLKGILAGWGILLIMVLAWQALSVLVSVIVAGNDTLKHLPSVRIFAVVSLLTGFFVATAILIATLSYGQCAFVLQDLSGAGTHFYIITLLGLFTLSAVSFERLWGMLRLPIKKKR